MPYLGNEPGAITDAFTQTFTGDGSTTNFTLSQVSTTDAVFVRISGVMQRNGTDFTVSGTTLAFTTAPPDLANNIVVQFFTLGSVQEIAADAVTVDKLNLVSTASVPSLEAKGDGSSQDGYIQLNCSQNSHGIKLKAPPHSAAQSYTLTYPSAIVDGGFMKTDSSGNLSFATPDSGGFSFVSELTASTSANLAFEGLSGDFDYLIVAKALNNSADAHIDVHFGASTTYATANYQYQMSRFTQDQGQTVGAGNDGSGQDGIRLTQGTFGAGAGEYVDGFKDEKEINKLLNFALKKARYRVVVKRPLKAPFLANSEPSFSIKGKTTRFDVFVISPFQ